MRRFISLLACMISEAGRFLEVQNEFAGVSRPSGEPNARAIPGNGVWGGSVKADQVINYWKVATEARTVAERHSVGVSQGHQYALQLDAAREKIETALRSLGKQPDRNSVWDSIAGAPDRSFSNLESAIGSADLLATARGIAKKLRLADGKAIGGFVGALRSEGAAKAALGLLLPALP